jgi:hypothetical protein
MTLVRGAVTMTGVGDNHDGAAEPRSIQKLLKLLRPDHYIFKMVATILTVERDICRDKRRNIKSF